MLISIWSLEIFCRTLSYNFIPLLKKKKKKEKPNIHCGDVFVLQANNQKKTLCTLSSPCLYYTMANRRGGRNKQSFEEGSPLHFVLISLEVLGQNCLLKVTMQNLI